MISRELARNCDENAHYDPQKARVPYKNRLSRAASVSRFLTQETIDSALARLKEGWSPEQISGFLRVNNLGKISHTSIYKILWKDKAQGGKLYQSLRHKGRPYMKRQEKGKEAGRGYIPFRTDIKERPLIVEEKSRIGDLEVDLVVGAHHKGFIVTIVD